MGHPEIDWEACVVVIDEVSEDVLAIDTYVDFPTLQTFPEYEMGRVIDPDDRNNGLGRGLGRLFVFGLGSHFPLIFREWRLGDGYVIGRAVPRVLDVSELLNVFPFAVGGPSRHLKFQNRKPVSDKVFFVAFKGTGGDVAYGGVSGRLPGRVAYPQSKAHDTYPPLQALSSCVELVLYAGFPIVAWPGCNKCGKRGLLHVISVYRKYTRKESGGRRI
jgi:hypothetical protein